MSSLIFDNTLNFVDTDQSYNNYYDVPDNNNKIV